MVEQKKCKNVQGSEKKNFLGVFVVLFDVLSEKVDIFTEWSRLIYKNPLLNTIMHVGLLLNTTQTRMASGATLFFPSFLVPDELGLKRKSKHFLSFHSFPHVCASVQL